MIGLGGVTLSGCGGTPTEGPHSASWLVDVSGTTAARYPAAGRTQFPNLRFSWKDWDALDLLDDLY